MRLSVGALFKRPWHETDHLAPYRFKNIWSCTTSLSYTNLARCLIDDTDNSACTYLHKSRKYLTRLLIAVQIKTMQCAVKFSVFFPQTRCYEVFLSIDAVFFNGTCVKHKMLLSLINVTPPPPIFLFFFHSIERQNKRSYFQKSSFDQMDVSFSITSPLKAL